MTTFAPWRASATAVSYPSPLLAPVTTAVFPLSSGMSFALHSAMRPPLASATWLFSPSRSVSCSGVSDGGSIGVIAPTLSAGQALPGTELERGDPARLPGPARTSDDGVRVLRNNAEKLAHLLER